MRSATTGVVVLNYRSASDTLACLASLERSNDLDLDIVVVDNAPDDDAHEKLRSAVGRRAETFATGDNLGYAAGNNLGIARVLDRGCDLVWVLNPDTVVEPATLGVLRSHLANVPACGVVGPRLVLPGLPPRIAFDGGVVDRTRHGATAHLSIGIQETQAPEPQARDVDYVTGASLLVRREVLHQVGPIPEHYFLYYEEADWCLRARRAGWRVMVEQRARMLHRKRSSGALPRPYYLYYMVRNRYLFAESCLGASGESALADLDATFVSVWRRMVAQRAPDWLGAFDELVEMATQDARAGRTGRNDRITYYPPAEEAHEYADA
ncbi:MAG: glycosyltransferase family 2 protein [Nocardioides sp.]